MAKKENKENQDANQEPEEDFGLPDLEFEELEDLEDEEDEVDNLEDEIAEITAESSDEIQIDEENEWDSSSDGDSLSDIGASDEDASDSSSDIDSSVDESDDDELDEVEKFISEITADDENDESDDSTDSDIENQIDDITDDEDGDELADGETLTSIDDDSGSEDTYDYQYQEDEGGTSSSFTRIIIFGLVGAVLLAFLFLYLHEGDPEPVAKIESKPVIEKPVEEPVAEETTPVVEEETTPVVQEPVSTASAATPGEITTISASAGRYYIVVASFIDDDMAMDHANDLAALGASVKIVEPFNDRKYYRVSVADYGSRQEAINATEQLKSQYGQDIWALKY